MEKSSSGHKPWAKALEPHSWTRGTWPAASQSWMAPQCEIHLSTHSNSHDSSCSPTLQGGCQTPNCAPHAPSLGRRLSTSCFCIKGASDPRWVLRAVFCTEWTALTFERAGEQSRLRGRLVTPQVHGPLTHRAASDFVYPQSILCVCVPYMRACERMSVNSLRNVHFGRRLVTSHT